MAVIGGMIKAIRLLDLGGRPDILIYIVNIPVSPVFIFDLVTTYLFEMLT